MSMEYCEEMDNLEQMKISTSELCVDGNEVCSFGGSGKDRKDLLKVILENVHGCDEEKDCVTCWTWC